MKRMSIFPLLLVIAACSQANRAADNAHQLAWSKTDAVVLNLWNEARQLAVDKYSEQARLAAVAGDAGAAEAAVLGAIDTIDRLTFQSRYNYQRNRAVAQLVRGYILNQRNFLTVLYEQWLEAEAVVEAENAADNGAAGAGGGVGAGGGDTGGGGVAGPG